MPACELCWERAAAAARRDSGSSHYETYERMLRELGEPHTPEEQAGESATLCPVCERVAVHQHAGVCMACGGAESLP